MTPGALLWFWCAVGGLVLVACVDVFLNGPGPSRRDQESASHRRLMSELRRHHER